MSFRQRIAAAIVAALPVLAVNAAPPPPNTVRFALRDGGAVIVPVYVDGQGPHSFLIDTGANRSAVARGAGPGSRPRGGGPVGRGHAVGTGDAHGGAAWAAVGGRLDGRGLLVSVLGSDRLRLAGGGSRGDPGPGLLVALRLHPRLSCGAFSCGAGRRRPATRPPGPASQRGALPGRSGSSRVAPTARCASYPTPAPTGSWSSSAREGLRSPWNRCRREPRVESSSGKRRAVEMRRIRNLRIGDLTMRDQVAAVVPRPEVDAPEGDGLLPLHLFASVTFASQAGYLVIRGR